MGKVAELEQENEKLRAKLDQQNIELRDQISLLIGKLDTIFEANVKLRETNNSLSKRIETLEKLLTNKEENDSDKPVQSPRNFAPPKQKYDTLILSDSILRHVLGDLPKVTKTSSVTLKQYEPPREADFRIPTKDSSHPILAGKKVIIPGARCDRLFSEACRLAQNHDFDTIIICVGINHRWGWQHGANDTIADLTDFLAAVKDLFGCRVAYTPILPISSRDEQEKFSLPVSNFTARHIEMIRLINEGVVDFCSKAGIVELVCPPFIMDNDSPMPPRRLLARDGIHLSRNGILAMDHMLWDYFNILYWSK